MLGITSNAVAQIVSSILHNFVKTTYTKKLKIT